MARFGLSSITQANPNPNPNPNPSPSPNPNPNPAQDTLASIGQPLNWIANLTVSTLPCLTPQGRASRGPLCAKAHDVRSFHPGQVSTAFPLVFGALGRNTYLIFVALTAFFGWFTLTRVPETKGKTYEQVAKEFARY